VKRLLAVFALACAAVAGADQPLPQATGYVTDIAGLLSPATRDTLDQQLRAFDEETTTQVVVVSIPSLGGEEVAAYANRLARTWGIGTKEKNNGVLFLITKTDRKLRIEVGRGLEGALPDARAKEILDTVVVPELKQGKFDAGIRAGTTAIMAAVKGEYQPPARTAWPLWLIILIIIVVVVIIVLLLAAASDSSSGGGFFGDSGGSSGGGGGLFGGGGDFGGGGASSSY
jgi:uncharacterized protein